MSEKGKSLCWVCHKQIKQQVFGPHMYAQGQSASTCEKHATHKFVEVGIKDGILEIKEVKI